MIDEKELQLWISRLETEESSWTNYKKLAALYIIQNQNREKVELPEMPRYSAAPKKEYGDSDFLREVSRVDEAHAWTVMDELMDSLKIVNERVYNSVMQKLTRA